MTPIHEESLLDGDDANIAAELLSIAGVNYELMPLVRMTAPAQWRQTPIAHWPETAHVFNSVLLLFGFIPIDLHRFGLLATGPRGFRESSNSLIMRSWRHDRTIEARETGVRVIDRVEFEPRLRLLGVLLTPVYRQVFRHRHRRLRRKYGEAS